MNNDFNTYLKKKLKDPKFKKGFDEYGKQLEVAYLVSQIRQKKQLSQKQLAKKVGTTQSNIARIEAANQNLSLRTLFKLGKALGKDVQIKFV